MFRNREMGMSSAVCEYDSFTIRKKREKRMQNLVVNALKVVGDMVLVLLKCMIEFIF